MPLNLIRVVKGCIQIYQEAYGHWWRDNGVLKTARKTWLLISAQCTQCGVIQKQCGDTIVYYVYLAHRFNHQAKNKMCRAIDALIHLNTLQRTDSSLNFEFYKHIILNLEFNIFKIKSRYVYRNVLKIPWLGSLAVWKHNTSSQTLVAIYSCVKKLLLKLLLKFPKSCKFLKIRREV